MGEVKAYSKQVVIPTYKINEADKNPMFFEKRVCHANSGKVYPYPVYDKNTDVKEDKSYTAVFLENDYLSVMILPEIGGKIHRLFDKVNDCDAVYRNDVIKPVLAGLTGPYIAGGIEFNWPQYQKASAFSPMEYTIMKNPDNSKTVWVGEFEKMHHIKGMCGFTLYPDKAYLEVTGRLYNPTGRSQAFLWRTSSAVNVNENTQSVFPPDVKAVEDDSRCNLLRFPIMRNIYNKDNCCKCIDISRPGNIPIPASYTAIHSDCDFIGAYDYRKKYGFMQIADHRISPVKKQQVYGKGTLADTWFGNVSDDNNEYAEIMTGAFGNNQSDMTYIGPYEEKRFTQYFVPYKYAGAVKAANQDLLINLDTQGKHAEVCIYASSKIKDVHIKVDGKTNSYINENFDISPNKNYNKIFLFDEVSECNLKLTVSYGSRVFEYSPAPQETEKLTKSKITIKSPRDISSLEELYLTASYLEQCRIDLYGSEDYYLEGLGRDEKDIRLNNGYGRLLYNKGDFKGSEKHFKKAIERMKEFNPNPYDTEPYYNLGLSLKMQGRIDEALDAFYKAIWSLNMQSCGCYQLAAIYTQKGEYKKALEFTERSLSFGNGNVKARNLRCTLLRIMGKDDIAQKYAQSTIVYDPLDFGSRYELYRITNDPENLKSLQRIMRDDADNYIELSLNYLEFGLPDEAGRVLALVGNIQNPMLHYYMAYYSHSDVELDIAAKCSGDYCFPNRINDIPVLEYAMEHNKSDCNAPYYLGNLMYDKGMWGNAIDLWESSKDLNDTNPTVFRNLAIAYYNKRHKPDKAILYMQRAFELNPEDSRLLFELDFLMKLTNAPINKRLKNLANNSKLLEDRDDLYTEYITLLNTSGFFEKAKKCMDKHIFHPWEGGEGKISEQYRQTMILFAEDCMNTMRYLDAKDYLLAALSYPSNLNSGKPCGAMDSDIYYFLGCACSSINQTDAEKYFKKSAKDGFILLLDAAYTSTLAEMTYYSALSHIELGNTDMANAIFHSLVEYGITHLDDKIITDYFIFSRPEPSVFNIDENKDNFVKCCYITALGYDGLRNKQLSEKYAAMGLEQDLSHRGLINLLNKE